MAIREESYEFAPQHRCRYARSWNVDCRCKNHQRRTNPDCESINQSQDCSATNLQVIYGEQELFNANFFQQPDVKHVMPASLINWYQSDAGQFMKRDIGGYFKNTVPLTNEQQYQQVKAAYEPMLERVKIVTQQLNTHKSQLVFGSDTPDGPIYTQFPGLNGRKRNGSLAGDGSFLVGFI